MFESSLLARKGMVMTSQQAITEASGLGGFAVGGAPSITDFIGGTVAELTG